MKKFTQILLASFALMSLVFAGCNALKTEDAATDTTDGDATVEVTTEVVAPAADTTTTTTAQ